MKKGIAVLLGAVMIMSCACRDTTPSVISPISEHTSWVSESSKETTVSTSEETTAETTTETPEVTMKLSRDLSYIHVDEEYEEGEFYPRELTEDDYVEVIDEDGDRYEESLVPGAVYEYDRLKIDESEYAKQQEYLDAAQGPLIEKLRADYEDQCQYLKKLDESSYRNVSSSAFRLYLDLLRADTKVISFSYSYSRSIQEAWESEEGTINISSETGKVITLDDVITDKARFEQVLSEEVSFYDDGTLTEEIKKEYAQMRHEQIENGTLNFTLYYDRVEVDLAGNHGEYSYYYDNCGVFSVPVYKWPLAFNLDYFSHVPENYILQLTADDKLYWDFNGDGRMETLQNLPASGDPHDGNREYIIELGDKKLEFNTDSYWYVNAFVQADDGRYLYLSSETAYAYCVRVEDDLSMTIVDDSVPWMICEGEPCQDPARFRTRISHEHILGHSAMYQYWSVVGGQGIPTAVSPMYADDRSNQFVGNSKKAVPAVLFDMETRTKGEEISIPKGSGYEIVEYDKVYDKYEGVVLFRITPPGEKGHDKDYYVLVDYVLALQEDSWFEGKIGGINEDDVFDGITYGG